MPRPSILHQQIVWFLAEVLRGYVSARKLGTVLFAPIPVRIRENTLREPDALFIAIEQDVKPTDKRLNGAALVMEVVSDDDESHNRDYQKKRFDYADLGIPEYWIVDPQTERITVLTLSGREYRSHGEFAPGQSAQSVLLEGFEVAVSDVFAAGKELP